VCGDREHQVDRLGAVGPQPVRADAVLLLVREVLELRGDVERDMGDQQAGLPHGLHEQQRVVTLARGRRVEPVPGGPPHADLERVVTSHAKVGDEDIGTVKAAHHACRKGALEQHRLRAG